MSKILSFIKNEIVMVISFVLAVISMFFVKPDMGYIDYIDFRTLALLMCLMVVMAGLNSIGLFRYFAENLLKKVKSVKGVISALVLMCFFSSMIITNDVALITFVPFTIVTLNIAEKSNKLIITVVLETVAANLGSMLTPIGNPQNLYLFSAYNMGILDFFMVIFPYALLSLIMLIVSSMFCGKGKVKVINESISSVANKKLIILYSGLFVLSLLGVFRVVNYLILFGIVVLAVIIADRKVLLKVDYSLLFTFIFLFVFIGNLGRIEVIGNWLGSFVKGDEVITGIVASQVFSNVPATLLLSGFTNNSSALLIGVNLGGLGTLIASMASLISFKFIQKEKVSSGKYLLVFTLINIVFLIANISLFYIIG